MGLGNRQRLRPVQEAGLIQPLLSCEQGSESSRLRSEEPSQGLAGVGCPRAEYVGRWGTKRGARGRVCRAG